MTSSSRGRRRSQSVTEAEYRCLATWNLADTTSNTDETVVLSLAHHNWFVFSLHRMHQMRTIGTDNPVVCLSVTQLR